MAVYGTRVTNNRVKPGGDLGSKQYFYTTDKTTGEITVTRIEKSADSRSDVTVGTIPKGGKFTPSSDANAAEKTYYNENVGKVRSAALQTARKEWDGVAQPPPNTLIYGEDSLNKAYDPAGAATPFDSVKESTVSPKTKEKKPKKNEKAATLVYPTALRQSDQDFLKIDCLEYAPKVRETAPGNLSGFKERGVNKDGTKMDRRPVGTAMLPIPGGITSTDTVAWGSDKMDPAAAAMANIALTTVNKSVSAGFDEFAKSAQAAVGSEETRKALSTAIAGQASGTGSQLLQRTAGAIINPNMELLFKDPGMRQFSFNWKLAPRSASEARTVISLIRFFKQQMAVKKSNSNLYLKAPNTWRLAYKRPNSQDHPFLNKFKECAMTSFTANFTPDGNYATFEDGVMTSYDITMAFSELEPIFSNDYDEFAANEIGY
jgi:hypothetical protein